MSDSIDQIMSESIDQLATALAKAQGEFTVAGKSKSNPFFKSKYADLESVVEASRPSLSKYGLSVVQSPFKNEDGSSCLVTILMHASGQWVKSISAHNPAKNDIQSLSSYNTYLKRMCYTSIVGVVTGDEDDDGEGAMIRSGANGNVQSKESFATVDNDQIDELNRMLDGCPNIATRLKKAYNLNRIEELQRKHFFEVTGKLRDIIAAEGRN